MADTTSASSNAALYNWLTSLSPAVIALASLLVGTLAGGGGYAYLAKPGMLPAADPPRPVPMVSLGDVDTIVKQHCDEILARLPPLKKAGAR